MNTPGLPLFVYIIITTYIFWMLSNLFALCRVFLFGCMYVIHCSLIFKYSSLGSACNIFFFEIVTGAFASPNVSSVKDPSSGQLSI